MPETGSGPESRPNLPHHLIRCRYCTFPISKLLPALANFSNNALAPALGQTAPDNLNEVGLFVDWESFNRFQQPVELDPLAHGSCSGMII